MILSRDKNLLSWLASCWTYKCPRCRQAKLFKEPLDVKKPLDMNKGCSHCNLNFEPEPGFYYGAMFISYIITAFLFLAIALMLVFYFKWSVNAAMAVVIVTGMLIFLKILRVSRSVYIHILVKYDKTKL